jgi:hypothetical protein
MPAKSDDPEYRPYPVSTGKKKGGRCRPPPFKLQQCAGQAYCAAMAPKMMPDRMLTST